ncbi:WIAG-tail domain [Paenibacillus lautus]|uniref:WIAG-tail domain n=1 Tax=Paenibacillus lautus TaxID=1401 RepID=UPI003D2BDF38
MNKARRITRIRRGRPFRRYDGYYKKMAIRGTSANWSDLEKGMMDHALTDDVIGASHLQHRSVRSEAIEDYAIHSIHLSSESIISSKLALESVQPSHLSFNPVHGIPDIPLLQQFGSIPFTFTDEHETIEITVPLQTSYQDEHYVVAASCSDPVFQAGIRKRQHEEVVIGITRSAGTLISEGWLYWISIGRMET